MVFILKKNAPKTLKQQLDEFLLQKKGAANKRPWNKFFGKVKFTESPVEYQRKWR